LPIAVGIGAGAESRRPLGLAVVGGLLFSTFLTLLLVPVVYTLLARFTTVEDAATETSSDEQQSEKQPRKRDVTVGQPATAK
jgi:HAE1 family hydrophobic/amphiphilic exporter-1